MTINKPGSVDQEPYYECAGCYDYQTHHSEDLCVHKNHAWCYNCWDYHRDRYEALPPWHELERFVPALQAENTQLHAAIRRLCNIYVVDDCYDGQLREEHLDSAVNRAINAVKETTK